MSKEETIAENIRIYENMNRKPEKTKVDIRLLELLEKDMEEFYQGDEEAFAVKNEDYHK